MLPASGGGGGEGQLAWQITYQGRASRARRHRAAQQAAYAPRAGAGRRGPPDGVRGGWTGGRARWGD